MGTISLTIPTAGSTLFSDAAANVDSDLGILQTVINGNLDGQNLVASLPGRRLVTEGALMISGGHIGGTFLISNGTTLASGGNATVPISWAYLDPANFAVTNRTTQLVLRMSLAANATSPGQNITGLLVAVTFAGASASTIVPTIGSTVTNSTTPTSDPTGSTAAVVETSPFTFPSAGAYALAVNLAGSTAANSGTLAELQLFAVNS